MTNQYVGIDYGKPGGDMTGITARCPKCQRIYSMSFEPGAIVLMLVELQCACGEVTSLQSPAEPTAPHVQADCVTPVPTARMHEIMRSFVYALDKGDKNYDVDMGWNEGVSIINELMNARRALNRT